MLALLTATTSNGTTVLGGDALKLLTLMGSSFPDAVATVAQHCGVNIEPGDVDGFVEAVLRFRDDDEYLDRCRRNSRAAAETRFSRRTNVARVLEIIRPLLAPGDHA